MQREFPLCRLSLFALALAGAVALPLRAQEEEPAPEPALSPAELAELKAESPLSAHPKTPIELVEAAISMVELGRNDLAAKYLGQLSPTRLTEEELVQMRRVVGSPALLKLDQVLELRSLVDPLISAANLAEQSRAAQVGRIAEIAQALQDPAERFAALSELRSLGALAAPTLIGLVAREENPRLASDAATLLIEFGTETGPLLNAMLESPDPRLQSFAADLLGRIAYEPARADLMYLASAPGIAPAAHDAARRSLRRLGGAGRLDPVRLPELDLAPPALVERLVEAARRQLRREAVGLGAGQVSVVDWSWDESVPGVVPNPSTARQAADRAGARHVARALLLRPDHFRARVLDLAFAIGSLTTPESIFGKAPVDSADIPTRFREVDSDVAAAIVGESLDARRIEIAAAAVQWLGDRGQKTGVLTDGERLSPLLRALEDADPRVQFAAALAIEKIGPKGQFRGGRRVVEVFQRNLTSSSGRPHVIVGEVSAERGAELSGMLKELGFETLVAVSGREAFRAASERADVELVVLHPNIIRWTLTETLANLRADSRTARLPVVIYGPSRLADRFRHPRPGQTPVHFASYAESSEDLEFQLPGLLQELRQTAPTARQQKWMRSEAIAALRRLAERPETKVFELSGTEDALAWAAAEPEYSQAAVQALSSIGTRRAQLLIGEFILNSPGDPRTGAARKLLDSHVERFGLLLPPSMVRELHATLAGSAAGELR